MEEYRNLLDNLFGPLLAESLGKELLGIFNTACCNVVAGCGQFPVFIEHLGKCIGIHFLGRDYLVRQYLHVLRIKMLKDMGRAVASKSQEEYGGFFFA